jgi:hypothetical protein
MSSPYTREKIENWVSDFCLSDAMRAFDPPLREIAASLLVEFLAAACDARSVEPDEIEEPDLRAALLGPVARLNIPEVQRREVPTLCAAFLASLQSEGRLSGGRALGAFVSALAPAYLEAASGKQKPITRPGAKIGRNDPCPCGSGKKYKKCCAE